MRRVNEVHPPVSKTYETKYESISYFFDLWVLLLAGCGNTTGSRSLNGAGMGAAAGGIIGSMSGNFGSGALIGAGVGAAGGYLYDQHEKGNID